MNNLNRLGLRRSHWRTPTSDISHVGIMLKLLRNNIDGYFYRILNDMYSFNKLHVCVKISDKRTDISEVGVRQWYLCIIFYYRYLYIYLYYILYKNMVCYFFENPICVSWMTWWLDIYRIKGILFSIL
jgi:hypothetical protein